MTHRRSRLLDTLTRTVLRLLAVAGLLAMFAIAAALDYFRFSPSSIFWFRIVAGVVLAGAAAWWASEVGRSLEPTVAWEMAPRPPLFGPLCDKVYRRVLRSGNPPEGAEGEP